MAPDTDKQTELEALRTRIAELETANAELGRTNARLETANAELRAATARLERENGELAARTNATVAAAQERAYWLDRWHLDLNALMRKPGAGQARALVRAARAVLRAVKKVRRRLLP